MILKCFPSRQHFYGVSRLLFEEVESEFIEGDHNADGTLDATEIKLRDIDAPFRQAVDRLNAKEYEPDGMVLSPQDQAEVDRAPVERRAPVELYLKKTMAYRKAVGSAAEIFMPLLGDISPYHRALLTEALRYQATAPTISGHEWGAPLEHAVSACEGNAEEVLRKDPAEGVQAVEDAIGYANRLFKDIETNYNRESATAESRPETDRRFKETPPPGLRGMPKRKAVRTRQQWQRHCDRLYEFKDSYAWGTYLTGSRSVQGALNRNTNAPEIHWEPANHPLYQRAMELLDPNRPWTAEDWKFLKTTFADKTGFDVALEVTTDILQSMTGAESGDSLVDSAEREGARLIEKAESAIPALVDTGVETPAAQADRYVQFDEFRDAMEQSAVGMAKEKRAILKKYPPEWREAIGREFEKMMMVRSAVAALTGHVQKNNPNLTLSVKSYIYDRIPEWLEAMRNGGFGQQELETIAKGSYRDMPAVDYALAIVKSSIKAALR